MMAIRCLVVDDEPLARNLLAEYISKLDFLELVSSCSTAIQAMDVLKKETIDLLFLDIQMPEITGISFLRILDQKPNVILTTAYSQYALEGYELDVLDYLLKPITFERFLKSISKAQNRINPVQTSINSSVSKNEIETKVHPEFVFIKDGTKMVRVNLSDILYIQGLKDYVIVFTKHQKITSLQRMKVLEDQLPKSQFMRIHHSYIISLAEIEVVYKTEVQIRQNRIPISETYRKEFKEFIDGKNLQQP